MIEIVSATRYSNAEFWDKSALGLSLRRLNGDRRLLARIAVENKRGLPEIYNERIRAADSQELLVFMHDDVWIDDFHLADRVADGLQVYDVIGVVGNRRRVNNQPSWAFVDDRLTWDDGANFSGSIAHGARPFGDVLRFGTVPADCELLDGALLAAKKSALKEHEVLFDPRFAFHFYDLDFCRSARQRGLRLGTWPICVTHQSPGAYKSEHWKQKFHVYLEKWGS